MYSINIVYFELGQGKDYVYHGKTVFRGLHDPDDVLKLSARQRELFMGEEAGDVFPEYYVLRVNDFDKVAKTPLDEWISFLKTGRIEEGATAKGLPEARERLRVDSLSKADRQAYIRDMEAVSYQRSVLHTGWYEGHADGLEEGRAKGKAEGLEEGMEKGKRIVARSLKRQGVSLDIIRESTGLSAEEIENL